MHRILFAVLSLSVVLSSGCNAMRPAREPNPLSVTRQPLTPEEGEALAGDVAENWLFGHGLGETMLAAGVTVLFPPYAAVLLGNGVLALSGYEPIGVSDLLPTEERATWERTFDTVTSGPGRLAAAAAGREFISRDAAKERLQKYLRTEDSDTNEVAEVPALMARGQVRLRAPHPTELGPY